MKVLEIPDFEGQGYVEYPEWDYFGIGYLNDEDEGNEYYQNWLCDVKEAIDAHNRSLTKVVKSPIYSEGLPFVSSPDDF